MKYSKQNLRFEEEKEKHNNLKHMRMEFRPHTAHVTMFKEITFVTATP